MALHPDRKRGGYSQKRGMDATRNPFSVKGFGAAEGGLTTAFVNGPRPALPGSAAALSRHPGACAIARILWPAPGEPQFRSPCPPLPNKYRGRAGRFGSRAHASLRKSAQTNVLGPTDLDASQHRGTLKSGLPQVRQTQGVPRAVFNRSAPHRPRWRRFQAAALARGRLSTAWVPVAAAAPVTGDWATPSL